MRSIGVLLIGGLVLGLGAALVPSLGPVWNARPPKQLELIGERTRAWIASTFLFAGGLVVALFGVLILSSRLIDSQAQTSGWIAIGAFGAGTTLWLIHLGYRMTVMVSVSRDIADGAEMPDWFLPSWNLGNYFLATYVILASVGLIALGVGILQTGMFPAWSAWAIIGLAAFFILTIAVFRNTLPVFPHLATGLLGILALINPTAVS